MTNDKKKDKAYSSQKIQAVEKKILSAIKKAKKANLNIVTSQWGVERFTPQWAFPPIKNKIEWVSNSGCACPGGAVLLFNQPSGSDGAIDSLASLLNVDVDFVSGFTSGVDNGDSQLEFVISMDRGAYYEQGYKLGCKFHNMIRKIK